MFVETDRRAIIVSRTIKRHAMQVCSPIALSKKLL